MMEEARAREVSAGKSVRNVGDEEHVVK